MVNTSISSVQVIKKSQGIACSQSDLLAVEEPLEIRLGFGGLIDRKEKSISVTMRTPGQDLELAIGFLFTEGIINATHQVLSVRHCEHVKPEEHGNVIRVELQPEVEFDLSKLDRHFYTTSSCGVCGKTSIEAVHTTCGIILTANKVSENIIHQSPDKLREAQRVFEYTGGLHAAGLFSIDTGNLLLMREDVGRHNAVDKLIGALLNDENIKVEQTFILVSGRASFELVQKVVMAKIPIMAAVGAPSSLAADLAGKTGLTLLGFVRNESFNIYCGNERIEN
ncbi:MAG TPA: formate dehydrogenase accessory sulfurtransferase FdhD [Fulvivirga sp.]|nr:formate dehydrogenase accessory sulfurtransferase FdhD [Fulvivirga sp.]